MCDAPRHGETGGAPGNEAVPEVSVLIVNYNTAHLLDEMFAALEASARGRVLQYVVVDNASRDDSVAVLRSRYPRAELIENKVNVGFGRANNQALERCRAPYVLLLNTDAFVASDTLDKTLSYMNENPDCGLLGVRLVGRDGALQPSCRYFPTPWNVFLSETGLARLFPGTRLVDDMRWDHASVRTCDWVPGCYYLLRHDVVRRVGLFDPRYFLYYEEVDHCRAVKRAGWQVVYYPYTSVVHVGGESAKSDGRITSAGRQLSSLQVESELLYFRKHHGLVGGVALSLLLSALGSAIVAAKATLKRLAGRRATMPASAMALRFSLARRTGFGAHPTR